MTPRRRAPHLQVMREVVTVQAGEEANWVGAYFWALQEQRLRRHCGGEGGQDTAAASSVLYESAARSGAWEPRTLLVDAPDAFNPFRAVDRGNEGRDEEGNGPAARAAALTWGGGVEVHTRLQEQQRMMGKGGLGSAATASPSTWAEAWHGLHSWPQLARHCVAHTSSTGSSNSGSSSEDSGWSDARGGDQLRRLLEGCDAPQGAHVLVDMCGPWLGYGVAAAEEWAEEVGGGGLACLALHRSGQEGPGQEGDDSWRLVQAALGVHRLLETGALLLPLGVEQPAEQGRQEERRARQAVGLAAASGVYVRGGGCHMLEWTRGLRSGSNSGLASLELGFPFPPPDGTNAALSALLQPADPRDVLSTAAGPPSSGLLSHLLPLTPGGPEARQRLRRISGAVSLYHHPGGGAGAGADVLRSLNEAAKFYPWFQPHLNYAEPRPFPVRRWPFPSAWRATEEEEADDGSAPGSGPGFGALAYVGCTSLTLPFLHELSGALRGRGPGVRARLREERGLLDEDVAEVEEGLEQIWAPFEEEAEREAVRG